MAGFVFERDLAHQNSAVSGVIRALDGIGIEPSILGTQNPRFMFERMAHHLLQNINALKKEGQWAQNPVIDTNNLSELIFDISMETGTGKTYAYTKTMMEINKQTGVTKFIIAVPRVAIKAGTVGFLTSPAAKEHFREQFDRDIKVYEVKSEVSRKNKKDYMPQSISEFCRADSQMNDKVIHVMVINSGMINSPTLEKQFDVALFDAFNIPHEAIANTRPILIIDEPHTFRRGNTTYQKLMRFKPQFTLRYGATFNGDLVNLVYELSAVEAFNQDLVKGIVVHEEKFEAGENIALRFIDSNGSEATFELNENGTKTKKKLAKGESFETIHHEMSGLILDGLNQSTAKLSNGLELKKKDRINPYSYAATLQEKMVKNAIVTHFENERQLMMAKPLIKPLSLFFIDDIDSYRDDDGALRTMFEGLLRAHIKRLISEEDDKEYREHLETALQDIAGLHGGYFSKDNSDKDDKIEKETIEILHDKEALLDIDNPRRFIFSKWTLREGWDNPNVFVICKLRSSGSETSKLQEVGRGLRLPVNEYMGRDRSGAHALHYFVDFTETEFVEKLTGEINGKSGLNYDNVKLDDDLKAALLEHYAQFNSDEDELIEKLVADKIISISQKYKDGGYDKLKEAYPTAFEGGLKKGKVKSSGSKAPPATIRAGKYLELKQLWEAISEKTVLEYKVKNSDQFKALFSDYLTNAKSDFEQEGSLSQTQTMIVNGDDVSFETKQSIDAKISPFVMMKYGDFLKQACDALALSHKSVHAAFTDAKAAGFDIGQYMNHATIRTLKQGFNDYLMQHAFGKFEVGYKKTENSIHPTKFTNEKGKALSEIISGDVGTMHAEGQANDKYLFNEIFYDGQLELENIKANIAEVIVYSKIPKNSIRIPLVGGGTYSPDFAYVIKGKDGKSNLNLVVETKGKDEIDLGEREAQKIKHAAEYFSNSESDIDIVFKRQLNSDNMLKLIKEAMAA